MVDFNPKTSYLDGDSFVHRVDPKVKLIAVIFLIAVVSGVNNRYFLGMAGGIISLLVIISGIPFGMIQKRLKFFSWFFMMTVFMHIVFTPGTHIPHSPFLGVINITYDGISNGLLVLYRLLFIIVLTYLFNCTTSSQMLAKGIEDLLFPFRKRFPGVEKISSMILLTFQFLPLLLGRAQTHFKEYRDTGQGYKKGGIGQRVKTISVLVDSYFESVIKDAEKIVSLPESSRASRLTQKESFVP